MSEENNEKVMGPTGGTREDFYEFFEETYHNRDIPMKRIITTEAPFLLFISGLLDILGLVALIPIIGWALNLIVVFIGMSFFFLYDHIRKAAVAERRRQIINTAKQAKKARGVAGGTARIAKSGKMTAKTAKLIKFCRWLRPIMELIPYLNCLPLWTISTYIELSSMYEDEA